MNEIPTPNEEPDEADERYRRLSDRESSGPTEAVRSAVLRHAAELAAQVRAGQNSAAVNAAAAKRTRWRVATFGGLAAAAVLSGILLVPHFLMAPTAPTEPSAPSAPTAQVTAPRTAAPPSFALNSRERRTTSASETQSAPPRAAAALAPAAAAPGPAAAANAPAAPLSLEASLADPGAPLREAAQRGDVPALKRLLAQRPPIDARDVSGRTALMLAVLHGQRESVNILLAAGADPNAADASGTKPLQAALAGGRSAIAVALEQSGAR